MTPAEGCAKPGTREGADSAGLVGATGMWASSRTRQTCKITENKGTQ